MTSLATCAASLLLGAPALWATVMEDRDVAVTLRLEDDQGQPIANMPFEFIVDDRLWKNSLTDAEGRASGTFTVSEGAHKLVAACELFRAPRPNMTEREGREFVAQVYATAKRFAVPELAVRTIEAAQTSLALVVTAKRSPTGVFLAPRQPVDPQCAGNTSVTIGVAGSVWKTGISAMPGVPTFEVGGLDPSKSNDVFILTDASRVVVVHVKPADMVGTGTEVDGKPRNAIAFDFTPVAQDARVRIQLANRQQAVGPAWQNCKDGLVLIRSDGELVLRYLVAETGWVMMEPAHAEWDRDDPRSVRIPAGEYFVCPGAITSPLPAALYQRIRLGNLQAIPAAIPRMTVTAGANPDVTIDAAAAMSAARTLLGL